MCDGSDLKYQRQERALCILYIHWQKSASQAYWHKQTTPVKMMETSSFTCDSAIGLWPCLVLGTVNGLVWKDNSPLKEQFCMSLNNSQANELFLLGINQAVIVSEERTTIKLKIRGQHSKNTHVTVKSERYRPPPRKAVWPARSKRVLMEEGNLYGVLANRKSVI
jgi:hypothetical protein